MAAAPINRRIEIDGIRTRLGIARPVRQKHSVRLEREHVFRSVSAGTTVTLHPFTT